MAGSVITNFAVVLGGGGVGHDHVHTFADQHVQMYVNISHHMRSLLGSL